MSDDARAVAAERIRRVARSLGEIFDLSFAGDHLGGTGAAVDALAIATAVLLPGDSPVRHLSAAGFLSMKSAAFNDRGRSAPHASKDLADIAVLLAGRPQLLSEVSAANENVRRAACDAVRLLLAVPELAPAMRSHFRDRQPILPDTPDSLAAETVEVLERLCELA